MSEEFFVAAFAVAVGNLLLLVTLISEETGREPHNPHRADMSGKDVLVVIGIAVLALGGTFALLS